MIGDDVVRVLEGVASRRGKPRTIRVDNGPEFISRSLDLWAYSSGVKLDFSRPGKPTDNAFIESFNGRLRDEYLSLKRCQEPFPEPFSVQNRFPEDLSGVRPRHWKSDFLSIGDECDQFLGQSNVFSEHVDHIDC